MILPSDRETLNKIEEQLRVNCPSPEEHLIKLGKIVAVLPDSEWSGKLRRFVVDIDDLTAQIRWHLGQALLLMETQPGILSAGENDDDLIKGLGMSSGAQLLLRGYIKDADRVLFHDLSEPRRAGTAGGWIFHMIIDSAVYRTISAMDRFAAILWFVAELPVENFYFRSRKIRKIYDAIPSDETKKLFEIAAGQLWDFIIKYRDGMSHDFKAYSRAAGFPPSDYWETKEGHKVFWEADEWDAELLFALGRAAYTRFLDALGLVTIVCEKKWPIPSNLLE